MKKIIITFMFSFAVFLSGDILEAKACSSIFCSVFPRFPVVNPVPAPWPMPTPVPVPVPCCVTPAPVPAPVPCCVTPAPVPVPTPACAITNFSANTNSVVSGNPVTLNWSTNGYCNNATLSSFGQVSVNGSYVVYPQTNTNYTLSATGFNSSDSRNLFVSVSNPVNNSVPYVVTLNPSYVGANSATISGNASISGAFINSWLEFPCFSTRYGALSNVSSANMSSVVSGLTPGTIYSYCAVAQNTSSGQIVRGNNVSFTTLGIVTNNTNSFVRTNEAVSVTKTSATLKGSVNNPSGGQVNGYFEYGPTVDLGYRTSSKYIGNGGLINFSDGISGLSEDTIYFYRAVAVTNSGTANGLIEIFNTPGTPRTVVVNPTTPRPTPPPKRYKTIYVPTIVEDTDPIPQAPIVQNPNNNLAAGAFWGSAWLAYGPYFWLLIIIIILLIIILARSYRNDRNTKTKTTTVVTHDNTLH
jgi:hypothetical protein